MAEADFFIMKKGNELRSCPFCGNKRPEMVGPDYMTGAYGFCARCGTSGPWNHGQGVKRATRLWNTREGG
jgi:hypothetical protein